MTIFATRGISLALQQGLKLIFGPGPKPIIPPVEGTAALLGTVYPQYRLILIGLGLGLGFDTLPAE